MMQFFFSFSFQNSLISFDRPKLQRNNTNKVNAARIAESVDWIFKSVYFELFKDCWAIDK